MFKRKTSASHWPLSNVSNRSPLITSIIAATDDLYAGSKPFYVNFIPFQCQPIVDLAIPSFLRGHMDHQVLKTIRRIAMPSMHEFEDNIYDWIPMENLPKCKSGDSDW